MQWGKREQTSFRPSRPSSLAEQEYYIGRAVAANILAPARSTTTRPATDYLNVLERALAIYSDRPGHLRWLPRAHHGLG